MFSKHLNIELCDWLIENHVRFLVTLQFWLTFVLRVIVRGAENETVRNFFGAPMAL